MEKLPLILLSLMSMLTTSNGLYCYDCVSTHPGCGKNFNWIFYWGIYCPEYNDRCVKLIERKGDEEIITRACVSTLTGIRTDIPADKYEGCRQAAKDVKLANYVNHTIKEHDVKRDYYDEVTWCFCHFDDRCNSASKTTLTWMSGIIFAMAFFLS